MTALAGRAFLVVGGGSPFAGSIARRVAAAGAAVLFAHAADTPDDTLVELGRTTADLQDEEAVERLFETVVETLGELHGVMIALAPPEPKSLVDLSLAEWAAALEAPLRSLFWLMRATVNEFLYGGGGGRIVIVLPPSSGDVCSQVMRPAVEALARSIAKEYGARRIACNVVLPTKEHSLAGVVETTLFLASSEAAFVNGEIIPV